MKKSVWLFALLFMFAGEGWAQEKKENIGTPVVKVLETSADKPKCLLKLNNKLYVVSADDVKLIDNALIQSIHMYMPGMESYNSLLEKAKLSPEHIGCVFEIETKPGTQLPEKFKIND